MAADRNGMQLDIREAVLHDVLSQGCEGSGIGLERNDAVILIKLFEGEDRHADIAAAIEDRRPIVIRLEKIRSVHEDLPEQPAQARLAHERDLVAKQVDWVRRDRTTETFVSADDLLWRFSERGVSHIRSWPDVFRNQSVLAN